MFHHFIPLNPVPTKMGQSTMKNENNIGGIDRVTGRRREEVRAHKNNEEAWRQSYWENVTNNNKIWDIKVSKYNIWASQPLSTVSTTYEKEDEEKRLKERRAKLADLLAREQREYEEELKQLKKSKTINDFADQQKNLDDLAREKVRQQQEEQRKNQLKNFYPLLRNAENRKNQESMQKCLIEQIQEKQLQKENEKALTFKLEEEEMKQRLVEAEQQKEAAAKKHEEMKQLRTYLIAQMEEIKKRDVLAQQLKLQEQEEIKLKVELENIAVRRNLIERQRRNREFGSFLRHQYQLQLKQRTKEVQRELHEDKRLIEEISRCLENEETENNKTREETRKQIDLVNGMLVEFTRLEKEREKEMEFLFFEEAKKMWHKQEIRWNAEQDARNSLMREVLRTVQKQISEKLQKNIKDQNILLKEKEDLLESIETLNRQVKETEIANADKKKLYMTDLLQQINEKELEKQTAEEIAKNEFLKQQKELEDEEQRILDEISKLSTSKNDLIK